MNPSLIQIETLFQTHPWFVFVLIAWTLAWKGAALWKAAQLRQSKWFIAILIMNTLGLVEIIYLYFVAKKYKVEVLESKE